MSKTILKSNYRVINIVFICIILAIILHSFIFGTKEYAYPIPSGSNFFSGQDTLSTGLSRSFSAIVRFEFSLAKDYNPYGLRIFMFFFFQLIFRLALLFLQSTLKSHITILLLIDITISATVFIVAFWPFLKAWIVAII